MSWLSKALGLDKNKALLTAVNAAGNAGIAAVEANNPNLTPIINTAEQVGADLPTSTTGITTGYLAHTVEEIDPALIAKIETGVLNAVNGELDKLGVPKLAEAAVDSAILAEFRVLGIGGA